MRRVVPNYYDYFEARPLGSNFGERRRNAPGHLPSDVPLSHWQNLVPSSYCWHHARELEGRANAPMNEGVWPINCWRADRYFGDPGQYIFENPDLFSGEEGIAYAASRGRLHHYYRVRDEASLRRAVIQELDVRLALDVTPAWRSPDHGWIEIDDELPVVSTHAIPIGSYNHQMGAYHFRNSWGADWGDEGFGFLPAAGVDKYIIDGWVRCGTAVVPEIFGGNGLVELHWKAGFPGHGGVHGREIVNADTGERIAWAFAVRRDNYLDIEEFFVWPSHRMNGYGNRLADLLRSLAIAMKLQLRAWIPFADAELQNRNRLINILAKLRLHLHNSPERWAAFMAVTSESTQLQEPVFPKRPAAMHEELRPVSAEVLPIWGDDPAEETREGRIYRVWFGTNRRPVTNATDFTSARSEELHLGHCDVFIPRWHDFGSVGTGGIKGFLERWCLGRSDDRLSLQKTTILPELAFVEGLQSMIASFEERELLVFVHGYRVNFKNAAIRAAQIGFDLSIPGATAFYSWPSLGTAAGYAADEATVDASEQYLERFLLTLAENTGAKRIHILAHSMGNRALLRVVDRAIRNVASKTGLAFGQVFLAAPDVDRDLFRSLAPAYAKLSQRTTLYVSEWDFAVLCSESAHGAARVGLIPPLTIVNGIDTVDVKDFALANLGHGYYAAAESVLHDMFDLLRRNAAPSGRQRIASASTTGGQQYFTLH